METTVYRAIELWKASKGVSSEVTDLQTKYADQQNGIYTIFFQAQKKLVKLKILTLKDGLKLIELQ
jgi:hypothetical protein